PRLPQLCLDALAKELELPDSKQLTPNSMHRILLKIAEEYAAVFLRHDADKVAPLQIVELENERDYVMEFRSEEHTSELQSRENLDSFPTRRASDLHGCRSCASTRWRRSWSCQIVSS